MSWRLMQGGMVCIRFKGTQNAHRLSGKTTSSQSDEDLSIDILVEDFCALLQTIYPDIAAAPTLMVKFILHYKSQLLTLWAARWTQHGRFCLRTRLPHTPATQI